ncbi:MAG: UDP-N-acetylmuramoyl-tripeptide--D-alanyl-D-alanine ligase [Candidatus Staskawiczbacteria bacterium]|nr:UDP-N-acetylmuramoyl-tripeptide--D-alanyl-D-alanine ligase [Candidatus Staskawiczbacteria bacterium]
MYILLSTLWFIWMLQYVLFWLYLWQLKDYHIGRFVDHFRTHKGQKLIFNFVQIFKLFLIVLFFIAGSYFNKLFSVLFLIYLAEAVLFLRTILKKSVKKPIITSKTIFLISISFAVIILFLFNVIRSEDSLQPVLFSGFDILTPLIISVIVLLFQPIFVMARNNTLRKAKEKMEKIKSVSGVKVVAVTGSYGKTSTKEFLSTILSKKFKVLKTKDNQNSEIGVAKCILQDLKPSHQIFIAEVGAYDKGKVKEVCFMLKPSIGIVTGVNEQHLSLFGSMENLLSAEGGRELADVLPEDGILMINGNNKYCLDLYKEFNKKILLGAQAKIYSLSNKTIDSDIWADEITVHKNGISFLAINKSGEMAHFDVDVLGKHNIQNLLGAILMARELGMSFEEISEACKNILEEQAGMILKAGKHGINVIDSSYSANPDGVYADLDYFSVFTGKKIIVMPCLIELGDKSSEIHEKIGKKIVKICDLAIITTKDKFKELKKGAQEAGMAEKNIVLCDNPHDIYSLVTLFCKSGDAVLLEGRVPNGLINLLIK